MHIFSLGFSSMSRALRCLSFLKDKHPKLETDLDYYEGLPGDGWQIVLHRDIDVNGIEFRIVEALIEGFWQGIEKAE